MQFETPLTHQVTFQLCLALVLENVSLLLRHNNRFYYKQIVFIIISIFTYSLVFYKLSFLNLWGSSKGKSMCTCTHTHILTCIYIHTQIYIYIYIHICTPIHTYVHTLTYAQHICEVHSKMFKRVNSCKNIKRKNNRTKTSIACYLCFKIVLTYEAGL